MRGRWWLWLPMISVLGLASCGNSCESLMELTCERYGGDSRQCLQAEQLMSESSPRKQRLCDRALMLFQSLKSE